MEKTLANQIAGKVATWEAMRFTGNTEQTRRDARNRLSAYVDCYRLATGRFSTSWDSIIAECKRISS